MFAATRSEMRDHWTDWRPEWTRTRTCLYWYLTFREDQLQAVLGDEILRAAAGPRWLDAVPPEWCHVTVTDVGFTDELSRRDVDRVTEAVADAVSGEDRLRLSVGPVQSFATAVVLTVGPLDRLRAVKATVRRSTAGALGPRHADVHRRLFWPHLSLGYVNRPVEADTVTRFLAGVPPVQAEVDVDALTLAAVTRRDHRYQWEVQAQVDLLGAAAMTSG
jgi:2'-5' RNA ligase